ncbi:rhamnogalacturonan acetylesterase [Formosa sp. 4Alg 33]|uniref:rhamnogalacturonan acetylesterase n=1 Tax=Formosa sp. 4Alg 33 TaxID=3382189 RepID=UPI003D9C4E9D
MNFSNHIKIACVIVLCITLSAYSDFQEKPITVFMIGDSTMANKKNPETNPEYGWGQVFATYFNTNATIKNKAVNGRSSRSFINEGRWDSIYDKIKPGDYVFIQFGHNDQKIKDSSRYTNPYTQYRYNLERFVNETREKKGVPILLSSIVRRDFNEYGSLIDSHGAYPLVTRMVAEDLNVQFIDLQWYSETLEMTYGPEKSAELHLHFKPGETEYYPEGKADDTHLSFKGASEISALVVSEIKQKVPELATYFK